MTDCNRCCTYNILCTHTHTHIHTKHTHTHTHTHSCTTPHRTAPHYNTPGVCTETYNLFCTYNLYHNAQEGTWLAECWKQQDFTNSVLGLYVIVTCRKWGFVSACVWWCMFCVSLAPESRHAVTHCNIGRHTAPPTHCSALHMSS